MFRKRLRKKHPQGTFIPTPARICAIIQLCIAFTMILWYSSQPFVGEIFTLKSRLIFYQDIMGIPSREEISLEKRARLKRNEKRFHELPIAKQIHLKNEMESIQEQFGRSFLSKIGDVVKIFAFQLSPYELSWLILSVILPILLLKRVEGASQAVWLLPLLAACYSLDNRYYSQPSTPSADILLFPSEKQLLERYGDGETSPNIFKQQEQLKNAWQKYLVIDWTKEEPNANTEVYSQQIEQGEFLFTLARIDARSQYLSNSLKQEVQHPTALLALYLFWNTFFSCCCLIHLTKFKKIA